MNYDVILNANESAILETQYSFTQGDYGQIQFSVRVKADGQYVTDAMRAYIVFTLPNGMIVTGADMPKTVATYTYVFQGNELQAPGKVVADVKLVYTSGQVSSNKFTFICRYDPLADKSVPAGTYITELQKIVDEGQEKLDYLQALIDALEQGIGETPLTRADLQNNRDVTSPGVKALDAAMAQFILLKGDMTNQIVNDNNKVASASSVHSLQQTTNTSIANLNSNLAKIVSGSVISDPNGNNYIDIPLTGISANWGPIAFNGDYTVYPGSVLGCTVQTNNLRVHLSTARSGATRINYVYFVK